MQANHVKWHTYSTVSHARCVKRILVKKSMSAECSRVWNGQRKNVPWYKRGKCTMNGESGQTPFGGSAWYASERECPKELLCQPKKKPKKFCLYISITSIPRTQLWWQQHSSSSAMHMGVHRQKSNVPDQSRIHAWKHRSGRTTKEITVLLQL